MKPEELYHLLHKRPFEPFRIYLTDGRVFDIRYPEINMVGVSYVIIGVPVPNDPDPVADKFIKVPLSLFDRVEPLSAAPANPACGGFLYWSREVMVKWNGNWVR